LKWIIFALLVTSKQANLKKGVIDITKVGLNSKYCSATQGKKGFN